MKNKNNFKVCTYNTDIVIIGTGGSGLTAAIHASNAGFKVIMVSKTHPMQSHTVAAQGGINAALGNITKDEPVWHMYDTIKASDWLADEDVVEIMCLDAKESIKHLAQLGVEFDLTIEGKIDQKVYGGQSANYGKGSLAHRACYSADRTGYSIMDKLYKAATQNQKIEFLNYNFAVELLMQNNRAHGAISIDLAKGQINVIHASHVIVATGGYSQIYQTSTSSAICTGDGNALAFRAGIALQDMEFVQFHPTAISKLGILITEAARSAGGKLLNGDHERFMHRYAPKFMELASRDIIARSIQTEILEHRGAGANKDHVWLDLTHLSEDFIKQHLPTIFENCQKFLKINPSSEFIPVSPAAHYTMGGIPTDAKMRVIKYDSKDNIIDGLYAIGETACHSVHGAGRLGCNSLLDLVVFGKCVVDTIKETSLPIINIGKLNITDKLTNIFKISNVPDDFLRLPELYIRLKTIMQKYVNVFRTDEELQHSLREINAIEEIYKKIKIMSNELKWNTKLKEYLELGNMLICARATISAALWRKESRGSHFRNDYPDRDDENYLVHSIYNNLAQCREREVRKLSKYVQIFQPTERIY